MKIGRFYFEPRMLLSFSKAVLRVLSDLMHGKKVATSKEEYEMRMKICGDCPWNLKQGQCISCGCNIIAKASIRGEFCPEGKW